VICLDQKKDIGCFCHDKCVRYYHKTCIENWISRSPTCPFCRKTILMEDMLFEVVTCVPATYQQTDDEDSEEGEDQEPKKKCKCCILC
jgi:hypothetical protein